MNVKIMHTHVLVTVFSSVYYQSSVICGSMGIARPIFNAAWSTFYVSLIITAANFVINIYL